MSDFRAEARQGTIMEMQPHEANVTTSLIEKAKIQAQVLVPLVKALQAELGVGRANDLVRKALGDLYRGYGEAFRRARNEPNLGKAVASAFASYARDDALLYDVIEQSQDRFCMNVTRCRYAEFYQELGEPELGFLLVCSADFPVAEGLGLDIELTRTQTIMQGASFCDFRYKRNNQQTEVGACGPVSLVEVYRGSVSAPGNFAEPLSKSTLPQPGSNR
jgi:hypothetical protein